MSLRWKSKLLATTSPDQGRRAKGYRKFDSYHPDQTGRRSLVIAPAPCLDNQTRNSRNFAIPAPRSLTRLRFLQVAITCLSDAHYLLPGYRGHSGPHRPPRLPALVGRSGLFWTVTGSTPSPGSGIWAEAD